MTTNETQHDTDDHEQDSNQPDEPEDREPPEVGPGRPINACARCGRGTIGSYASIHLKKGWAKPDLYDSDPEEADTTVVVNLCDDCHREAFEMATNGSTMVEEFDLTHIEPLSEQRRREVVAESLMWLENPHDVNLSTKKESEVLLRVLTEIKHGFLDASVLEEI